MWGHLALLAATAHGLSFLTMKKSIFLIITYILGLKHGVIALIEHFTQHEMSKKAHELLTDVQNTMTMTLINIWIYHGLRFTWHYEVALALVGLAPIILKKFQDIKLPIDQKYVEPLSLIVTYAASLYGTFRKGAMHTAMGCFMFFLSGFLNTDMGKSAIDYQNEEIAALGFGVGYYLTTNCLWK